jgi:hypothetical protein
MKYIVTESKYEELLKASRERHSGSKKDELPKGSFDLNGVQVNYELYLRQDSVYSHAKKGVKKFTIFIMNEMDFLLLDEKEKKSVAQYRIKKYIEKKESLTESVLPNWLKRRFNKESMEKYIDEQVMNEPEPCRVYSDEFEYADDVISKSVDEFLTSDEDLMDSIAESYDEIFETLKDNLKQWFGHDLISDYLVTCKDAINEQDEIANPKIVDKIKKLGSTIQNEYLDRIEVDPEMEDGRYWVFLKFNEGFRGIEPWERLVLRNSLADRIEGLVKDYLNVRIHVAASI